MTAKEWLNRGYWINEEIAELRQAKCNMLDIITSTTPNYDGDVVSGTRNPHKFDSYAAYSENIDRRIHELMGIKEEIQGAIAMVPNNLQRTILTSRYVNFKSWEHISVDLNRSRRTILNTHATALGEVERIIQNMH